MKICVYCSSSNNISKSHFTAAHELGKWLAKNDHSLVYGGANVGLMEEVAKTFKLSKGVGQIIGIIPKQISDMGLNTTYADKLIETEDMKERKQLMRQMGDGFIALPGSFGTLDEIIEEIVLRQLNYHNKPIVFYDPNNFYEHLYKQFDRFFDDGFISENFRYLYKVCTNIEELAQAFN